MSPEAARTPLDEFTSTITKALRRAAKRARRTARDTGTAIYVCRAGKIVAIRPKKL